MKLSLAEVEHIADLARLKLSEQEKLRFAEQLSDILEYASRLDALDTNSIPPTNCVLEMELRLRKDVAQPGLSSDEALKNAAEIKDQQFKVPPVFGG